MKNVNLGLLGHVDSGKTTIAKIISTTPSTASFDKHPQSQERGITIDLGFSCFSLSHSFQITLVDCPGHSSLIRTVVGGLCIIDGVILVIGACHGIQHQTSECLLLAKIFKKQVFLIFNKSDLCNADQLKKIEIWREKIRFFLQQDYVFTATISAVKASGIDELKTSLLKFVKDVESKKFLSIENIDAELNAKLHCSSLVTKVNPNAIFMADHVFSLKGQGTIFTGTLLAGSVSVGDALEIPCNGSKKVKSIHVFKQPRNNISAGDRAGICFNGVNTEPISSERILIGTAGAVMQHVSWLFCDFNRIEHFRMSVDSKSKYHFIVGHEMRLAKVTLLDKCSDDCGSEDEGSFSLVEDGFISHCYAFMQLDSPICISNPSAITSNYIASKLDIDLSSAPHSMQCRFAFYGKVLQCGSDEVKQRFIESLNITKYKERIGIVDRIVDNGRFVLVKNFSFPNDPLRVIGKKVELENGVTGMVDSFFGQSKVKVEIMSKDYGAVKKDSTVVMRYKKNITHL